MNINKETILTFLILIIFSSGLAIFVWNKLQGKDLSQPPNFDLSVYDNFALSEELNKRASAELQKVLEITTQSEKKVPVEAPVEIEDDLVLEKGYIYFRDSFQATTVEETNLLIKSFLKDFPELAELTVENFETRKKIMVTMPALSREELLANIKSDDSVLNVGVIEPPIWQIEFNDFLSEPRIVEFFKKYPDVTQQDQEQNTNEDYVARIVIPELPPDNNLLQKLQKEYSDVLEVVL